MVTRRRLVISLTAIGFASPFGAFADPALGCLPRERIECGCTVRLPGFACHHLYSGLADGSPLWIVLDGRETELESSRPASQSFSFSRGDSWSEKYVGQGVSVAVSYRPGSNTCRKPPPETCEYFDVRAVVTLERNGHAPLRYEGVGACGC